MSVLESVPTTTPVEQRRLMGKAFDLSGATDSTSARALAGLDWEPVHRPLYVDLPDDIGEGGLVPVEKERAVVRNDTGEIFGVVGREHQLFTNADMFEFADVLLGEADTTWAASEPFGGALGNGKAPFLVFQLGEGVKVAGQDAVNSALMLANGHVGNTKITMNVITARCKCSNIVTASLRAGKAGQNLFSLGIQHSGDLASKVQDAKEALALQSAYMVEFAAMADRLAAVEFDQSMFNDLLTELVPLSPDAGDRAKKTVEDTRAAFRTNWRDTLTLDNDLKSTAWGALNVIAEVIDHGNLDVRKSKVPAAERRVRSVHFGSGAALRNRAYSLLGGL